MEEHKGKKKGPKTEGKTRGEKSSTKAPGSKKALPKNPKPSTKGRSNALYKEIRQLKNTLKQAQEENNNLLIQVNALTIDKQKSLQDFHAKAQTFAAKAQTEIEKFKVKANQKHKQEIDNFKKYNLQKLFESVVDPLNNMHTAILAGKQQNPETQGFVKGFEMLLNQLLLEFENFGLKIIEPRAGEEYNPELHKVIAAEPGVQNKIVKVLRRGFTLNDRVIEPASVTIGK